MQLIRYDYIITPKAPLESLHRSNITVGTQNLHDERSLSGMNITDIDKRQPNAMQTILYRKFVSTTQTRPNHQQAQIQCPSLTTSL